MNRKLKKPKPIPSARQRQSRLSGDRPSAFSYYARRSDEIITTGRQIARSETAEKARAASRYWRQRFGFAILLIAAAGCLVYISTLSTKPRIVVTKSSASAAVLQDSAIYERAVAQQLDSSVFNRNKLTVSTRTIAAQLMVQFPELASVQVSLPLLTHRVAVTLVAAEPVLILATSSGSYALDSNGTALLTGAQLAALSSLQLPLVTDDSALPIKLRQQGLTSDNVNFILTVIAQLGSKKLVISGITLPAGASQLDVRLEGQPYYIKFNLASNSARQQAGTLIAVYERLQSQKQVPAEYIDVRVDGRAYYR